MINKIGFKNYKSFKDFQEIKLNKLTVLIGKNSSGKSAIAKLPTLIENSLSGKFDDPLLLLNDGVELGGEFRDLVYGRRLISSLDFVLEDSNEKLSLSIASGTGTKDFPKIISYSLNDKSPEISESNFKGFRCNDPNFKIKSLSLETEFIGPFRSIPQRVYYKPNTSKLNKVGINGELAYSILIQDSLTREEKLIKKVSDWYQKNFDGWGVKVNQDKDPFYQIELTRDSDNLNINIVDVGEGMSQALPLVTRAFMENEKDLLIIMEQPELHLHPSAHGNLAELFVESTKNGNKNYLIETHSQNFILRLRRLIAEKNLKKEELSLYFVDFDEEEHKSNLREIIIDDDGNVDYWPENIFNESLDEALAIRKAQKNNK